MATGDDSWEGCDWKEELFLLSKLIRRLRLSIFLLKAKLLSLYYKAFVFLNNLYAFEWYLSHN